MFTQLLGYMIECYYRHISSILIVSPTCQGVKTCRVVNDYDKPIKKTFMPISTKYRKGDVK